MSNAVPAVWAIVLHYGNISDTIACVSSVAGAEYPSVRTLVVDNSPGGEAVVRLANECPGVEVLASGSNLGYAGGMNAGIRRALAAGADYVVLLNNDVTVRPGALSWLVRTAEEEPRCAFVGGKVLYADAPERIWMLYTHWDWLTGQPRHVGHNAPDSPRFPRRDVDYVTGTALLAGRDVLERVGLMDERFFLYFEDVEWGLRALRAGYRCIVEPRAVVAHGVSVSSRGTVARPFTHLHYYFPRGNILFMTWFAPWWARLTFWPFFIGRTCTTCFRVVGSCFLLGKGRVRARLEALLRGCLDGLRRRTGPRTPEEQ